MKLPHDIFLQIIVFRPKADPAAASQATFPTIYSAVSPEFGQKL